MNNKTTFAFTAIFTFFVYSTLQAQSETRVLHAAPGTPTIDGTVDEAWDAAPVAVTDRYCASESTLDANKAAKAKFRCMWDEKHVYVLAQVTDAELNNDGVEDWQNDSVEVFIDENLARASSYDNDDAQYRVDLAGTASYGSSTGNDIEAAVQKAETGYVVEMAIPLAAINGADGTKIGFDVQVNDDHSGDGQRDGLMKWNDASNDTWQSLSAIGTLILSSADNVKPYGGGSESGEEKSDR